jgi:UDP-glucose 4-epimerase
VATSAGKVFVTGGAGFIGSNLVPILLKKGYVVTVFDNLSTGKEENIHAHQSNPNFVFVRGDIRKQAEIRKALKGSDAVVHLAAQIDVTASVKDPAFTHEVNVTGTLNVLQEAAKEKVRRFVFASSTAVYGDAKNLPVKELEPLKPISPYAASKAAAEAYCSAYAGCFGLDAIALRFFNVYGPKNENSPYSGVITKFLGQAARGEAIKVEGDGEQTRDFIHIDDITRALALALESKKARGEAFNVCTGKPTSINGLVDALEKVTGKDMRVIRAPARVGDIRFSYGDGSKAAEKLGFKAKIGIASGLRLLLADSMQ